MTRLSNQWRPAAQAILSWWRAFVSRTVPAKADSTDIRTVPARNEPELLLMRMEALHLDPVVVKAARSKEFRVLAHVCDHCQDKVRCERDLICEAAGKAAAWERYCPNAPKLRAIGSLAAA